MSVCFVMCIIYSMICKELSAQVVTKSFKRVSSPNVNVTSSGPTFIVQSLLTCATRISQGSSNYFFYQPTTKSCYAGIDANVSQIPNGAQVYQFDYNITNEATTTAAPTMIVFDTAYVNFTTASSTCTSKGAHLIKFDNLDRFNVLTSTEQYPVGCADYVGNNIFYWTYDGSQVSDHIFTDYLDSFYVDYTSDSCCLYCANHRTIHIYPCTEIYYFICEKY